MENATQKKKYPFLQGGGEMGKLTRNFNWEVTSVGSPDLWPQSLRTTVSNLLRSRIPMFLWWGEDLIQFYNDAYQPSFGTEGRHPKALGQPGKECWPEIWDIIFPLIQKVKTSGEPSWHENQLIPIYRNEKMEDVYWTFCYSLVLDDIDNAAGVLVTCMETKEAELIIANKKLIYENELKEQRAAELIIANEKLVYENEQKEQRAAELIIANKEQLRVGKALKESENNLRHMILQAPVAMCILRGPEYTLEIANTRMFEFWGKPKEILLGKPIFEGMPEAKEQGLEALLENVYTTGNGFKAFERPLNLFRGMHIETIYVNFVYEALYEDNGRIAGIIAVAVEVTEQVNARQRIEEVVEQRTKELAEANIALKVNNQELKQFAYIASHDLQEPLRKVSTFTEKLKENLGEIDERSQIYLDKITTSTQRMMQLIQDVLNFSQLSTENRIEERVDLNCLIESLTSDFELVIEQKGATIIYNNLPTLKVHPLQMRQLFGNLLSNGLKFTKGNVSPVITISANSIAETERTKYNNLLPETDYCIITVADNGIGFSQEYAKKIFNIFERLHGKTEFAGTGIGLAMCKRIAQNHNGEIWATSANEKGSAFHVILPKPME